MEYRPIGAGVLHLFLANSEYHRRVPILATYRFFYHIYGADHQRGYFWRDIRVLPDTVDHLLRAAYREDPQCSALNANNHGRHHLVFIVNENLRQEAPVSAYRARKGALRARLRRVIARWGHKDCVHDDKALSGSRAVSRRSNAGIDPISDSLSRGLLTKTLIVLVALSVIYSTLLCLTAETGWYSDVYPWAYHDLLELFLFWT